MRKLSHPWHGPYQVIECNDPNLTVSKVYYPGYPLEGIIQVHQGAAESHVDPDP